MMRAIAVGGAALVSLTMPAFPQQQPFRGGVDVVTLDVSVRQNKRPIEGLTAADFIVSDNGVRQSVDAVSIEALPLDLTLVVDTSGSMDSMKEELKNQIGASAGLLKPADQIRVRVFSWITRDLVGLQPASIGVPLDRFVTGGNTSLNDAVAATLMQTRPPGRGQLAVLFTDGVDTTSSVSVLMLKELARRSDMPIFIYMVRSGTDVMADAQFGRADYNVFSEVADTTGGRLESILSDNHVVAGLARVLDAYRKSYTVRYTASGVERKGWHDLTVTVRRPGEIEVRTRKGYFGG